MPNGRLIVLVHGGAGTIPNSAVLRAEAGTARAARAGLKALLTGGSAVDACVAAVRVMEDDTHFNAGTGSVLNRAGFCEMDALIQEGRDLRLGCVTGVRKALHPISLARAVMDSTPHAFLAGEAAEAFASSAGMEFTDPSHLVTPARQEQLRRVLAAEEEHPTGSTTSTLSNTSLAGGAAVGDNHDPADLKEVDGGDHDTVGCVAIDAAGNVAAATSTGGLAGKWVGRVGDSPVVGAGGCADNASGAVSTTGTGEHIMRFTLARRVAEAWTRITAAQGKQEQRSGGAAAGQSSAATRAVEETLQAMRLRLPDPGEGVIFIAPDGDIGIGHSSERMSWAVAQADPANGASGADIEVLCGGGVQLGEGRYEGIRCVVPQPLLPVPLAEL